MEYRKNKFGENISLLGFGCMRFTQKGGNIDIDKAQAEIMEAFKLGVNYYDTAYIYKGSEVALGEIFSRLGIRSDIKIATKLPQYMVKEAADIEKFFNTHLERLRTDYIDFYLMHMLTDIESWNRLVALGIEDFIAKKKSEGVIKNIGFSYHGNTEMFLKILDAYDWDFCQIQYNYLDENTQGGRTGLEAARKKGIPVVIMEPLRGGRLVNKLPKAATEIIENHTPKMTPAEAAFRWLYDQEGIMCVLSGMNSLEMVRENAQVASSAPVGHLTEDDHKMFENLVEAFKGLDNIGCTGCRYCMPCPKNVDIPGAFSNYNRISIEGWFAAEKTHFMATALRKDYTGVKNCVECGKCETHCPQNLPIREDLKRVRKKLEGPFYSIARAFTKKFLKY